MTHLNFLAAVILFFIITGSIGWLGQEIPALLKKKFFSKKVNKSQKIVVGMYYKP